jgi:prevent-host-death family protein
MDVSVYEAKTQLSRLIDQLKDDSEIVITRHGKPVAKLVAAVRRTKPRRLGLLKGKLVVPNDFNAPLTKRELAMFEGALFPDNERTRR